MKILLLEYVTGGGLRHEAIPPGLAEEGGQMRQALARDLLALPGVALIILHDDRLPTPVGQRTQTVNIAAGDDFAARWRQAIHDSDAVWPIAPETDGVLEQLCLGVETAGKPLLTSPAAAVRVAASKQATARRLAAHGLPVVPTLALAEIAHWPGGPLVVKPDDGAGCEGAIIIHDPAQWPDASAHAKLVMQPLLTGEALSLSVLFAQGQARLLSVNRQMIEQTATGFRLLGCQVNAYADPDRHWQTLVEGVAHALPDLWGYAGIDLILTHDGPMILEINPRLTTSYAALHAATGENPAAYVLELLRTGHLPNPRLQLGQPVDIRLEQSHGG